MDAKRLIKGSTLVAVGFMLSPLSWWNDLFVNVPLALVVAWLVSMLYPPAFSASFVAGYWLTNLLGFVLMHKGGQSLRGDGSRSYNRTSLKKDLIVSLFYTVIIAVLIKLKVVAPLPNYILGR